MKIHGNEFTPIPASPRYGPDPGRADAKDFDTVLRETAERPSQTASETQVSPARLCGLIVPRVARRRDGATMRQPVSSA